MQNADNSRRWMFVLLLGAVFTLALALLFGRALAQDGDFSFDPVGWGANPALATLALAGAVAWLRQTRWGQNLDGPVHVALVAALIGAAGGVFLQYRGYLTLDPYAGFALPLGGILYGLAIAVNAVFGVSLFNYGTKKVKLALAAPSPALGFIDGAAAGGSLANTAIQFILDYLRGLVGQAQLPKAIEAVAPLLAQLLQSPVILTDDVRAELQSKVLTLVRKAGLVGQDL